MKITALVLYVGLNSGLFTGSTFHWQEGNLSGFFDSKYQLKNFNEQAIGFTPESGEYTSEIKYKFAENDESLITYFVGWKHQCMHRIDEAPTLENMEYGAKNRLFIEESK